jgi:hypothetical protein
VNNMTQDALMQMATNLFAIVATLTGQPLVSDALPEIHRVPHAQIEAMACQQTCRVRAIYIPHLGVYIDDNLDIELNVFDRSILLHELVHHAQAVMGKYEDLSLCQSWKSSEIEAYRIQDLYLARMGSAQRIPHSIAQALRCP